MSLLLPQSVKHLFLNAGWFADRIVSNSSLSELDHPAAAIFSMFAGLHVEPITAVGIECATSDIAFELPDFGDTSHTKWEAALQTRLVTIALVSNEHTGLLVATDGRCFELSYMHDCLGYLGQDFAESVERLLLGIKARPMLRPDQDSVVMYGETFTRNHSALYAYDARN